jgi:ubiquinone/menaquinone biosynthesis C-methylase UbiE
MTNHGAEIYSQQANPAFETELARRTACRDAAFLLPHLFAGMDVLDVGCGPGSITLGLAEIVAPGQVLGIDSQAHLVAQASLRAAQRGLATARFEVADLYRLPYADASFDAVFANGVLMHLREPVRALAELRRVLRPAGVAGIRDPDFGTALFSPLMPRLEHWLTLRVRVRQFNGGDPFLSRHYRRLLLEAGFKRSEASASIDSAGNAQDIQRHAVFLRAQLHGIARTAMAQAWTDQAAVAATAAEIDAWAQRPDAFAAMTWCQAIGWRCA